VAVLTTIGEVFLRSPRDDIDVACIAKMNDDIVPYRCADERSMEQIDSPEFAKTKSEGGDSRF
jgi:hypothetical protein